MFDLDHTDPNLPPDVSLMLRAHAEQRWLSREVIPVLRQIETRELLPEEQIAAALAYLEVIWVEAQGLAEEADASSCELEDPRASDPSLCARARRYHAVVRDLRAAVARRVAPLLAAPPGPVIRMQHAASLHLHR
jgi:hypothetical protein